MPDTSYFDTRRLLGNEKERLVELHHRAYEQARRIALTRSILPPLYPAPDKYLAIGVTPSRINADALSHLRLFPSKRFLPGSKRGMR